MSNEKIKDMYRKPTHPGEIIKYDYLEPLNLSVTKLAEYLGVSRIHVSRIVNVKSPVTANMALRLAKVFNTTPELWLGMQQQYDLYVAKFDDDSWRNAKKIDMEK